MLGAGGIGADRLKLLDERVLFGGAERVAVAGRFFELDRGPVQLQRLPVEVHLAPAPGELAQADVRGVAALARDVERQFVEVGAARGPQRRRRHGHGGGHRHRLFGAEVAAG